MNKFVIFWTAYILFQLTRAELKVRQFLFFSLSYSQAICLIWGLYSFPFSYLHVNIFIFWVAIKKQILYFTKVFKGYLKYYTWSLIRFVTGLRRGAYRVRLGGELLQKILIYISKILIYMSKILIYKYIKILIYISKILIYISKNMDLYI